MLDASPGPGEVPEDRVGARPSHQAGLLTLPPPGGAVEERLASKRPKSWQRFPDAPLVSDLSWRVHVAAAGLAEPVAA